MLKIILNGLYEGLRKKASGKAFFLIIFALIFARLLYQASYFPAYHAGEESSSLDACVEASYSVKHGESVLHSLQARVTHYAKGYSWIMWPFYGVVGYDTRLITYLISFFCAVFCALFFLIIRIVRPDRAALVNICVVVSIAIFALCVRRYKWHTVSYLSVCGIYIYFLGVWCNPCDKKKLLRFFGVLVFLVSIFFYFGNVIYVAPFVLLIFMSGSLSSLRTRFLWGSLLAGVGIVALSVAFKFDQSFLDRVVISYDATARLFDESFLHERRGQLAYLIRYMLTTPTLVLFAWGLIFSLWRTFRCDHLAFTNIALLSWALFVHFVTQGLHNPDGLNWAMLPFLGICLAGADQVLIWFKSKLKFGYPLYIGLAALFVWNEMNFYPALNRQAPYQQAIYPYDTKAQSALILRFIKEKDDFSDCYFLPDPSVRIEDGGFDYPPNLERVEFSGTISRIVFFKDADDLRVKLSAKSSVKNKFIFLSVSKEFMVSDATHFSVLLPGVRPVVIYPFESIYGIKFPVRFYNF